MRIFVLHNASKTGFNLISFKTLCKSSAIPRSRRGGMKHRVALSVGFGVALAEGINGADVAW
ncbi:hypothetical protein, partial [Thermus sp.]|uniref:hypothetical protein n=1 Tax=Thermus sp. TaxID=275 RepID=UPI00332DE38B